jgi:hypothetical protein
MFPVGGGDEEEVGSLSEQPGEVFSFSALSEEQSNLERMYTSRTVKHSASRQRKISTKRGWPNFRFLLQN